MDTLLAMAIDLATQLQADPRCEAVKTAAAAADAADSYYLAGIPLPDSAVWGVFYQLRSVTVLGGELIVEDAFAGCPALEEINLPE